MVVGVAADHLDGDVLHRPMDDHGVFEALVDQDLLQAHPASFGRLVQQGDAGLVVVRARSEDHHTDDGVDAQNPASTGRWCPHGAGLPFLSKTSESLAEFTHTVMPWL